MTRPTTTPAVLFHSAWRRGYRCVVALAGRRDLADRRAGSGGRSMADAAGHCALPVCRGDQYRHADAIDCCVGDRRTQSEFHRRESPRRDRQYRRRIAARAAPDGYTLLFATLGPIVTNKFMYKHMDFDPDRAFTPVMLLGASPLFIASSPKLPVTNLTELIAYAKANPGRLNAGTVGIGSQAHITLELIKKLAGISIVHVPYCIFPQALTDLVSGDLQFDHLRADFRAEREIGDDQRPRSPALNA